MKKFKVLNRNVINNNKEVFLCEQRNPIGGSDPGNTPISPNPYQGRNPKDGHKCNYDIPTLSSKLLNKFRF